MLDYPYQGLIYLDVPFDPKDELYKKLEDYFENPDGSMKDKTVIFWGLTLEQAMRNAHHDNPGYWDNW